MTQFGQGWIVDYIISRESYCPWGRSLAYELGVSWKCYAREEAIVFDLRQL